MRSRSARLLFPLPVLFAASAFLSFAADPPQAEISNGQVKVKINLPDAQNGFYKGQRFDWAGHIPGVEYNGHTFWGQWFVKIDPKVRDVQFDAPSNGYLVGIHSAGVGPVEEFSTAIGYDEAKVGESFLKIGVGALRKPQEEKYDHYNSYDIVDSPWKVTKKADSVLFEQNAKAGAYSYQYQKTVKLTAGKPEMVIAHVLKNTGTKAIDTMVYNHGFFMIDKQTVGPDITVAFPWDATVARPMAPFAEVKGRQFTYLKPFQNDDRTSGAISGFGPTAADYRFKVENTKRGAGVEVSGDQPMERISVWTIVSNTSPEAFVKVHVEPGKEFAWSITHRFYTLPK